MSKTPKCCFIPDAEQEAAERGEPVPCERYVATPQVRARVGAKEPNPGRTSGPRSNGCAISQRSSFPQDREQGWTRNAYDPT
jgi:hypothetical protein